MRRRGEPTAEPLSGREPYHAAAAQLLRDSGCVVLRWRKSPTGVAWSRSAEWYIEVPQPTTALRFAVFAHEVGHQMLHRSSSLPRYVEEAEAWAYALLQFPRFDLNPDNDVMSMVFGAMDYAHAKAIRRGAVIAQEPQTILAEALERIVEHPCLAHHRPGATRAH